MVTTKIIEMATWRKDKRGRLRKRWIDVVMMAINGRELREKDWQDRRNWNSGC